MSILPPHNKTQVHRFELGSFNDVIVRALIKPPTLFRPSTQLIYLAEYLKSLEAKTIVVEEHYIDRHYMDEFQHYYESVEKV